MSEKELPLGSLVAYRERNAPDPMSGAKGVLRDEWRVRLVLDFKPEELTNAWGPDWRRYSPFSDYVLEHRYIRRGTEEPWMPFQSANSYEQALGYIDGKAVAICSVLQEMQRKQAEYKKEQERKYKEAQEEKRRDQEKSERKRKSNDAFRRMAYSTKFSHYAETWQSFCRANDNDQAREKLQKDEQAIIAYYEVLDAITVPKKVAAIKKLIKHAERLQMKLTENESDL